MRISLIIAILATLMTSKDAYCQTDKQEYSNVTVELVFSLGLFPLEGTLEIYSSEGGRLNTLKVKQEVTMRLPYGKYLFRLDAGSFTATSRQVTIDQPESFFVFSRAMSDAAPSDFATRPVELRIRIKVQPSTACGSGGSLWAKMVGAVSDYSVERKIGADGSVLFDSLADGNYVVMILDGYELRATQAVAADRKETVVDIKLKPCAPGN